MIFKILEIIFPVLIIALLGYFYAKKEKVSMEIPNKINLDVFIPILIFYAISEKLPSITTLTSFSFGAVIVVLGSGLILYPFTKFLKVNPRTFLPSMMFNNSINLGLPLALFAFGEEAMALFIALSIVQIIGQFTIAIVMYGGEVKLINLFKNPVIIATILGLFFNYFNFHLPQITQEPLLMLSQVSIPLILFSLGVRLASIKFSHIKIGIIGAILCPLSGILMAFFAIWIFDYTSLQKSLLILFGAMPPAVVNSLMAEKYGYDSSSVASIVAIGNIFSLIIIPIVLFYLI
ncbi:MAG: AEC family transporter [Arcobacter sp.]|jgi:predicted permease|uniref:AEC family transporter n=1 Tax=Arcobacter sp. TaxID=1872629 RepID=UPI002A4D16C3|nr:AEC family transporter [Arcobacter sp.]MDX9814948.1 AEC family transporter [Sulfurimonadaceae bacterium]MDY3205400.1 AEC family transporter [Arcobacter sp.]